MSIVAPFIDDAQKISKETGIPASIILGQIQLESTGSGGGLSTLAKEGNNLFGIKGTGSAGSIYLPTKEYQNGQFVTVQGKFRKYNSPIESMMDHAELLQTDRYSQYLENAATVEDFAKGIKNGGYATDPSYVDLLLGVISSNKLYEYDDPTISYNPDRTIQPVNAPDESNWLGVPSFETVFWHTVRAIIIFLLIVVAVVAFMNAFPAIQPQNVAKKATPIGRTMGKAGEIAKKTVQKKGGKK